jgi:hypothetical protein
VPSVEDLSTVPTYVGTIQKELTNLLKTTTVATKEFGVI